MFYSQETEEDTPVVGLIIKGVRKTTPVAVRLPQLKNIWVSIPKIKLIYPKTIPSTPSYFVHLAHGKESFIWFSLSSSMGKLNA